MNPATPLRAEITLHVDGTWQQGVDCEPAPPPPPYCLPPPPLQESLAHSFMP